MKNEISIIYMSCDKYSDLWDGYFRLFKKYWPQCPFKLYILANDATISLSGVEMLNIGADESWSDNLLKAIDRVGTKFVFLLLDDFFLLQDVPHENVMEKMAWAVRNDVDCLRFSPCIPEPTAVVEPDIGYIPTGAVYRTSTRFPLWKTDTLRQILKKGESAWDFEIAGSDRSDKFERFYATYSEPFKFANCVIKGRWDPHAVEKVNARGIQLDLRKRRKMGRSEILGEKMMVIRSWILNLLPYRSRRAARKRVQSMLSSLRIQA